MITTQGDREMHSNISIDLSKKNNSKRDYTSHTNTKSYGTDTRTYGTRNTNHTRSSSQTLYAQAVNGQLKTPAKRTTDAKTTATSTRTNTTNSTATKATASRANYTQ
jgi:hypothetical protein